MSIRTKMVLVFSVMSAVILLFASVSGYFFARNQFSEHIEKQMTATINTHVNKLDGWLIAKKKMVEITAGTIQASSSEGQVPAALLKGYKNVDKELTDVYFGSAEGKLVSGSGWVPPADFDPRTRVWYKDALREKKTIFSDPYVDADTNLMAVSVALPLETVSGRVRGVVSADLLLQTLVDNVKEISFEGQGYAFLVDSKGVILAHPDTDVVGKKILEVDKLKEFSSVVKDVLGKEQGYRYFQANGKEMIMAYKKIPATQWLLCINIEQAVAFQPLAYLRWLFIGVTVMSIIAVIAVTFLMARRITRPLKNLTEQVELLSQGQLNVQAEVRGHDEFSKLASGFNKMVDDLRNMIHDIYRSTVELQGSSRKLVDIASNVAANTQEMSATVSTVSAAVEQISAGSEENASSTEQVSQQVEAVDRMANAMSVAAKESVSASQGVAEEVKMVSALIEDVSQSINRVAGFAQEVALSCNRSIAITAEAQKRSHETNDIIRKLDSSSKQINSIVSIIRTIAEQTNMLALNATIEAASAGEAGKGFAVVAREVKELSKRTTEEAGRIARQIEDMQQGMSEAVMMVGKITDVIAETMDITQTIASAVSEKSQSVDDCTDTMPSAINKGTTISKEVAIIASKSERVAKNAVEAASGVEALFRSTAEISRMAEEVAHSTEEMAAMMSNISEATQEIAKGTQDISQSIQETDRAIADTAAKASTVSECAYDAEEMASRLNVLVSKFKV